MSDPNVEITITSDDAKAYFFRAMQGGYASATKPQRNTPFSGWKTLTHEEGDFRLVDMWHTTLNSTHSSGVTTIFWRGIPVWVMHYGGWYEEEAIPTLRAAIKQSYEQMMFVGGRGPKEFREGDFLYENQPKASGSDFEHFEGNEYMDNTKTNTLVGSHWYRGEWLVND